MANFYSAKEIEEKFYKICEERGYFEIDSNKEIQEKNKNFCIMMPPPNVTGVLHIGHSLTFTLQDILVRYKRMDRFKTLWQPGFDHAGIATQNVVEKQLLEKGIKKEDIGRDKFIEEIWKWKEKSSSQIAYQMRRLGISPAWSRERFTMDSGLKKAVKKAFVNLYNQGLIVRDNYMVNWCTHDGALSDIEVEHKENKGKLYFLKYFLKNSNDFVILATTRPETYFGDTAIMINPNDKRYKHLINKSVILPLTNKEIPIIADEYVDMEFGTGIVKVTPAHDINDYEVGKRHNLEFIKIFDENGILNELCGQFAGLERLKARDIIVNELDKLGYISEIKDYENQVGYCYRCGNVVEPYISKQWFVKNDIAKNAIEKTLKNEIKFYPQQWINSFNAWMKELKNWCISRQLWWGHQIPVFYCECGNEWADENDKPHSCPKCGSKNFNQDSDVLDTWFSSGLWPISTLGWGNEDELKNEKWFDSDLKEFYPNNILITGFDILFFWVARMMFQSENATSTLPFKDVYLHALVKDKDGNKMSKSRGNIIDPIIKIEEYSADILRFTLTILNKQGRDLRLSEDKLIWVRNFTNKLYNASNFLLLKGSNFKDLEEIDIKTQLGKYILKLFNECITNVRQNLENYRFNDAADRLYKFLWDEFCDWGIELSKAEQNSIIELAAIFKEAMKALNPFMPFITEYLYHELSGTNLENSTSIMIRKYPKPIKIKEDSNFNLVIEAIISIRRAKALIELTNSKIKKAYVCLNKRLDLTQYLKYIKLLAKCEEIEIINNKIPNSVCDISENLQSFIELNDIDTNAILQKLNSQKNKIEKEIIKIKSMLENENFIKKAPSDLIKSHKENLENLESQLIKINNEIKAFE